MTLPTELIARLRERIAQPARRADHSAGRAGAVEMPIAEIEQKFEANAPGSSDGLDLMKQKMAEWGFNLESMNFVDLGGGHLSAFSEDPTSLWLLLPAATRWTPRRRRSRSSCRRTSARSTRWPTVASVRG